MLDSLRSLIQQYLGLLPETQNRVFSTLIIFIALWIVRLLLLRIVHRRLEQDARALYTWRKIVDYAVVFVGVFLIGRLWIAGIQSLATYLGLLSAGLAIALQDLIVSLAGWAFIIWRRPFEVGDRIQIGDHAGDVIDVRIFSFTLLEIGKRIDAEQSTGRVIHIPNGRVFKDSFANYTQGLPYIWNEMPVLVTFESDWRKAKRLLTEIIERHAPDTREGVDHYNRSINRRFVITYRNVLPKVYTKVESSGVLLTIRYLLPPRERRSSEEAIWEDILHSFSQHDDIDFAYETVRGYLNFREGKASAAREMPGDDMPELRPSD